MATQLPQRRRCQHPGITGDLQWFTQPRADHNAGAHAVDHGLHLVGLAGRQPEHGDRVQQNGGVTQQIARLAQDMTEDQGPAEAQAGNEQTSTSEAHGAGTFP